MAEEIKVDINIAAKANVAPIAQVEKALEKVETQAQQTGAAIAGTGAGGNPWVTASRNAQQHATTLNQQVAPAQAKVAGSSRNMGNAVLQASRGIQDMQYGLAGAVNNMEGIASALGLSAGLAGAVTLVAVAVQTLGPHVIKWFQSLDTEGVKLDETKAKLQAMAEAILGEWTPASQAATDEADRFTSALKNQADAFGLLDKAQDASLAILKQRQSVDAEIAKTKEENDIADIKAKNLPKDEEARAIAAAKLEKAKGDRQRSLDAMQAEQTIAGTALENGAQEAVMAEEARQKLAQEKQRSLLQASLEQEIGGVKDKDGNVVKEGALDRVAKAEKNVAEARGLEGDNAEVVAEAEGKLQQEKQRLEGLKSESRENITANGGSQFRTVETIDGELGQASSAAAAAAKKKQDAEFEKSRLDKLQFEQKRKVENDYSQAQGKAVGGLPSEDRKPKLDRDRLSDPFEAVSTAQRRRQNNPRNLIAEEQGAATAPSSGRRNLVAEEKSGQGGGAAVAAMKELGAATSKADEALMQEIKRQIAAKNKLVEQMKNMRS